MNAIYSKNKVLLSIILIPLLIISGFSLVNNNQDSLLLFNKNDKKITNNIIATKKNKSSNNLNLINSINNILKNNTFVSINTFAQISEDKNYNTPEKLLKYPAGAYLINYKSFTNNNKIISITNEDSYQEIILEKNTVIEKEGDNHSNIFSVKRVPLEKSNHNLTKFLKVKNPYLLPWVGMDKVTNLTLNKIYKNDEFFIRTYYWDSLVNHKIEGLGTLKSYSLKINYNSKRSSLNNAQLFQVYEKINTKIFVVYKIDFHNNP